MEQCKVTNLYDLKETIAAELLESSGISMGGVKRDQ